MRRFILNDRADYAAILCAGLHVGQEDLSPADARRVVGQNSIVGYSTHNPDQMRAAEAEPVDYVAFGPVFSTASKERPDPTVGIDGLRTVRASPRDRSSRLEASPLSTRRPVSMPARTLSRSWGTCFLETDLARPDGRVAKSVWPFAAIMNKSEPGEPYRAARFT